MKIDREPWFRIFGRNCLTLLAPETFALMHAGLAWYYASIVLWPHGAMIPVTGTNQTTLPPLALLAPQWGALLMLVGTINAAVCIASLAMENRPHMALYLALGGDALGYAYIVVALSQEGIGLALLKVFCLHSALAVFFAVLVKVRHSNEIERDKMPVEHSNKLKPTPAVSALEDMAQRCVTLGPGSSNLAASLSLLESLSEYTIQPRIP